jgi:hypothetical protein
MAAPWEEGLFNDIKVTDIVIPAKKRKYSNSAVGTPDYNDAMAFILMYQKQVTRLSSDDRSCVTYPFR